MPPEPPGEWTYPGIQPVLLGYLERCWRAKRAAAPGKPRIRTAKRGRGRAAGRAGKARTGRRTKDQMAPEPDGRSRKRFCLRRHPAQGATQKSRRKMPCPSTIFWTKRSSPSASTRARGSAPHANVHSGGRLRDAHPLHELHHPPAGGQHRGPRPRGRQRDVHRAGGERPLRGQRRVLPGEKGGRAAQPPLCHPRLVQRGARWTCPSWCWRPTTRAEGAETKGARERPLFLPKGEGGRGP